MTYVLGVDGGNSKTVAALADHTGHVVGAGRSGGSNHQSAGGLGNAMAQVRRAVDQASERVGIELAEIDAAYYCLAGADFPEDFALLRPALESLGPTRCVGLDNDSLAILYAGTTNPNAVAVCWGAGTNAVGRNAEGGQIRLPAIGWKSGDWGGGHELAHETVRLVARAHDGRGCPTILSDFVLEELGVPDADEMIRTLYLGSEQPETGRVDLHRITPLLFRAATLGDAVACDLVRRAGEEVAITAIALLRRLDLVDRSADVVLGGSVFKAEGPLFIDTVRERLAHAAPSAQIILLDVEPVIGTILAGMRMLDLPVDETVRRRADASYCTLTRQQEERKTV